MAKRSDKHSVGSIVPEDYTYVLSYNLGTTEDGWPVPSFRVNCGLDRRVLGPKGEALESGKHDEDGRCCVVGLLHIARVPFAPHGGTGKCSVCGAAFVYGDIWRHKDGEHIHLGHTCAEKYEMLAERGDFDASYEAHKRATAARRLAEENRVERETFLDAHPGLREALSVEHYIVKDIAGRFQSYRSLSDAQVALVLKIAREASQPKTEEKHVSAPEGRVVVRGTVVSVKCEEGAYGDVWKMTVKVTTPDGTWLAWGTCPESLQIEGAKAAPGNLRAGLRGALVEFTATLKRGRDAHFALFSRPTKARVVELARVSEAA